MMGGIYSPYPNHSDAWFGRSSRSPAKDIPETPVWVFASEQSERLLDAFEGGAARFAELNTIGSELIRSGVGRTHFFSLQARKSVFLGIFDRCEAMLGSQFLAPRVDNPFERQCRQSLPIREVVRWLYLARC